jgi:hypothetical protein
MIRTITALAIALLAAAPALAESRVGTYSEAPTLERAATVEASKPNPKPKPKPTTTKDESADYLVVTLVDASIVSH